MSAQELKPCPFCSGKAEVFIDEWFNSNPGYSGGKAKRVRCVDCGAVGKWVHVDFFNMFSKHTVDDFRHNNALRASEEDRYEEYVKLRELEAIESWNTRI